MDKDDFFKRVVYAALAIILSMSGFDIVKQENPETKKQLIEMSGRLAKVEEAVMLIASGKGVIITRQ